jgi:2-keto-4-pentenoate hydratase/2-oxohepta-3-ene-1,7-dioic acid hydratase in catechol pathway
VTKVTPRLARLKYKGDEFYGAVGDGVWNLSARGQVNAQDATSILAAGSSGAIAKATTGSADYGVEEVSFLPFIPCSEKIFCIGVNYGARNEEYKDKTPEAAYPSVFIRTADSFTGHLQPLMRPPESEQLDYEGEIVIVIGQGGRRIPKERALECIAGLSLCNEGTLRDWVRHAKFNVTQGKNFEHSGSIGPWMVPAAEFDSYEALPIRTRVNGELRQDDTTANMIYSFAYLISYLSTFATLKPGDLIISGTPTGAGARFDPPRFLSSGDVVEVESALIGVLSNRVEDENP